MAGLWDSISSGMDSLTNFITSPTSQGLMNFGSGAFNLYSGINNMANAQNMYNMAYGTAKSQDAAAKAAYERYKKLYHPIEDIQAEKALADIKALSPYFEKSREYGIEGALSDLEREKNFYRPLREEVTNKLGEGVDARELMNQASADVAQGFNAQRDQGLRNMMRSGINPNSGAAANFMNQQSTAQALGTAGARTAARRTADDLDLARKSTALNYAKGMPLPTGAMPTSQNLAAQSANQLFGQNYGGFANLGSDFGTTAANQFGSFNANLNNLYDLFGNKGAGA